MAIGLDYTNSYLTNEVQAESRPQAGSLGGIEAPTWKVPDYLHEKFNGVQIPDFQTPSAWAIPDAYKAHDYSGSLPEYDTLRTQIQTQGQRQNQSNQEGMARRFAAAGELNSGEYLKQSALADQESQRTVESGIQNVGFQEAQTRRALQQQELAKVYQSEESRKQMGFQQGGALAGMQFQQGQARAGMQFQAGESAANRQLQWDQAERQAGLQLYGMQIQQNTALAQLSQNAFKIDAELRQEAISAALDAKYKHDDPRTIQEIAQEFYLAQRGGNFSQKLDKYAVNPAWAQGQPASQGQPAYYNPGDTSGSD